MGAWMVRAGRNAQYANKWLTNGCAEVYWDLGEQNLENLSKSEIRDLYKQRNPNASPQEVAAAVGQIFRFAHDIQPGETIVMYEPESRLYHLGTVIGGCQTIRDSEGYIHYERKVHWEKEAPRDMLSKTSRNSLGAISTIFSIKDDVLDDLMSPSHPSEPSDQNQEEEADSAIRYATAEDGIERIKDRIMGIGWEDMELLVAGFLRMLGYKTSLTPQGGDGGRDIIASPDGLGLEQPRIVAEVKHRKGQTGAQQVRAFIGGLRNSGSGLYVSTGGFSREARYEADRATMPVRLLDLDTFARLLVDNYDSADGEVRAILPLVRIYWPM